ncbi:MAG: hypothetical protein WC908_00995 [Candidatus Paceibacterota bacterium]
MSHEIGVDMRSDSEKQTSFYKGIKTVQKIKCGTSGCEYESSYRFRICPHCKKIDNLYEKPTAKEGVSDPELEGYNGFIHK